MATAGFALLCLACFIACVQCVLPCLPATHSASLPSRHIKLATLHANSLILSMFCLIWLRVSDDFSVQNVAEHSNRALPYLYKVVGVWGNHEGSMLLWVMMLSFFGLALARYLQSSTADDMRKILSHACSVQALLSAGFLFFIILTSNPFARLFPVPDDGRALNPLLQDIGLALHPPLLYVGYVGFSSVFSLSVAALLNGKTVPTEWTRITRSLLTVAWSALTLGIGLGSWWAYRELGWGGWWFWDPVENASLLPWFAGTALLHSIITLQKRQLFTSWVLLLSILTFAFSLLGTFLVRSGVLTSVHSFASDPERGLFILAYMAVTIGGGLLLYSMRAPFIHGNHERATLISREGLILINNLFLITASLTIMVGTLYPMFAEWVDGSRVTVGAPYYHLTVLPMMVIPILLAGIAPLLPWQSGGVAPLKKRIIPAVLSALTLALVIVSVTHTRPVIAAAGFGLCAWLLALSISAFFRSRQWPVFLAHMGVAIMVAGVTAEGLWSLETEAELAQGEHLTIGRYQVTLEEQTLYRTGNYMAKRIELLIQNQEGNHVGRLSPEFRFYPLSKSTTSEAAIISRPWHDIYAVVGASSHPEVAAIRVYIKPMMQWIWLGFILMAAGGLVGIFQRHRRHA